MTAPPEPARPSSTPTPEELADVGMRWAEAMYAGDFEAAWRQTDRIELPRREALRRGEPGRGPHHLLWDGTPLSGRDVLIRCEHGLGDSIQYLRYCPLVREVARSLTVRLQPALLPLFQGMAGVDRLVDAWTVEPDPPHEVAIECMELAYAFRHTAETLPRDAPYLPVERLLGTTEPVAIPPFTGRKVGLIWAASAWNPRRSIPLAEFTPLGAVKEVQFHSLQQGPEATERSDLPLCDLSPQTTEITRAAVAMLSMDLIITVDSMTAHLAGALGRPVWLLLTHEADWRWQRAGEASPWYPTMRIFRQPNPGDWRSVVQEVHEALQVFSTNRPSIIP